MLSSKLMNAKLNINAAFRTVFRAATIKPL